MKSLIQKISFLLIVLMLTLLCVGCMSMSPLQKAVDKGSIPEVDFLLKKGEGINEVNPIHGTALSVAALKNNLPMVKHLLDKGADVNMGGALSTAAYLGYGDLARFLIEQGADVNKSDGGSQLPLYRATERNHTNIVSLLLAAGANPNGDNYSYPLWIASYLGYDEIVFKLLEAKADPNLCKCLSYAVRHSPSMLTSKLLIEYGADVNARDESGMTALHDAAITGEIDRVQLLLKHGAKLGIADNAGKLALDYARLNNNSGVVDVLSQAGTKAQ